ncbi:MAG: hypothetical protein EZS28_019162 [Streblomastix strix]|uniref:RRM domain-containing protein n=1 Tax=Streblomastix strix TaxID=222440 RepID=A0A5J4VSB4_9EUKA|nr:MAG: hypothetical protein EZS28_019162 [Streblomastix strix]
MSQFPVVRQVPQGAYRVTNSGQYRIDNPCRLIINYVPQSLTPEVFNEMFVPYGTIVYSKLIMDKKSYGFVEYSKPEEAALAIQQLNGVVVLNKRLKVSYSRNPSPDLKNSNVYIAGYGTDLREEDLRMIFSNYGTIINMNMLKDKNGLSRGAAFIRLNSNQEAINAVNALNGTKLNGRIIYAKIHNSSTVRNGKEFIMGVDDGNDIYASFMNGTTNSTPIGENGLHRITYSASDLQDIPDANIHNYGAISLPHKDQMKDRL